MKKLSISQISTFFANGSYPIEFLFYFPHKINTIRLRRSLKKISNHFWPVFGTYTDGYITEKTYLEDRHYDINSVDDVFDPKSVRESLHENFGAISPELTSRLFHLKVLQYNNGTVLIAKMNHLVGDGYSYFFLLSVLAAINKRGRIPLVPSIIKAIFRPKFSSTFNTSFHFSESPPDAIKYDNNLAVEFLELEQSEIRNLAKHASYSSGLRISTNDILSAQVVKIIMESRKNKQLENLQLVIPIDVRRRIAELGWKFFGNGLILHNVPFQPEIVSQSSIEELAITIRKSLPVVNRHNYEVYLKKVEGWIESGQLDLLRPYNPDRECLVTNLTRMPVTKLDFGSGTPTIIAPLTMGRSGAAVLAQDDKFILRLVR